MAMGRPVPALGGANLLWCAPLAAAVTACLVSTTALAQRAGNEVSNLSDAAKRLQQNKQQLTTTERKAQSLKSDMASLRDEQARVNERLIETGRLAQQSELRMSSIEERLGELDAQEKLIRGSLAQRHGQMIKLFAAMQRMGRNPPPVIVTRREDALKMVRSAMLLARAFPELKSQADLLSTRLNDLVRVMTQARTESARLKGETAKLKDARTRLATLVESKRQSLADRQQELAEVRRSAAEISRSVSDLSELISRLDKEVAAKTELGAYDREQKERERREAANKAAGEKVARDGGGKPIAPAGSGNSPAGAAALRGVATARTDPAPGAGSKSASSTASSTASSPGLDAKAAEKNRREPQIALLPRGPLTQNPGRMKPAIPFDRAKGQLPLPAQGRRLIGFGDKTQFGSASKGLVIETRAGATVVSPSDGWVVYAGSFRSYGQVLIINAGGGYHILLANLARIDVEVGRFVLAAEPVGTMSTNFSRNSQDSTPVLYVEFRNKQGKSIDPSSWWAEGSQKVQG